MNEVVIKLIGNYSYQTTHCLGEGVYGKVYEGMERDTKEKVAIKKVDLNTFNNDKYLENAIFSEIYLLKRFNHPNIVKFKDVLSSKNSLYIVTEYCRHGDLKELIKKKRFREDEAFEVIRQIVCGFSQLVQEKIIHRDLKPANILIHEGVYKIGDFGFAKYVDNFGSQMLKSCVGSPIYMAPQLLERTPYTTKCDIWAIGIIFYEMLFGSPPWKARDQNQLIRNVKNNSISSIIRKEFMSTRASEFLKKTLAYEEQDRICWSELFQMFCKSDKVQDDSALNQPTIEPVGRNRYLTTVGTSQRNPTITIKKDISRYFPAATNDQNSNTNTSTITSNNNGNSPLTPLVSLNPMNTVSAPSLSLQKKVFSNPPSLQNGGHQGQHITILDQTKRTREDCAFKHFVCTDMFANHWNIRDYNIDGYRLMRLLYILAYSLKTRSSYTIGLLALNTKQSKQFEEIHSKMTKEQESYEELERDIQDYLDSQHQMKRIKEELMALLGSRLDIINEDRISKVERTVLIYTELLQESVYEFVGSLTNELRRRGRSVRDGSIIQLLDWMADILTISSQPAMNYNEISLMVRSDDSDTLDYLDKVLNRVDKLLSVQ